MYAQVNKTMLTENSEYLFTYSFITEFWSDDNTYLSLICKGFIVEYIYNANYSLLFVLNEKAQLSVFIYIICATFDIQFHLEPGIWACCFCVAAPLFSSIFKSQHTIQIFRFRSS